MLNQRIIRSVAWRFGALLAVGLFLSVSTQAAEITVGQSIRHDTSAPMRTMPAIQVAPTGETWQIPIFESPNKGRFPDLAAPDGGLGTANGPSLSPTPAVSQSFSGLSDDDNAATIGGRIVPPDVNGDIGLDDLGNRVYLQYINLIWALYSDTGALLYGPVAGNSFWSGFGGSCETNNDGDPVVLYDDDAGRWMVSQFSINQGIQCVAVSETSDPLGSYHRYAFTVTPGGANDYPKMGVWSDGTTGSAGQSAYTFTLRDFGGAGGSFSVSAGVMERDAMLTGAAAQFVKFSNPWSGADGIEGQLPPHLAGPTPPANTCPTYWTAVDAAYDRSPHAEDGYRNHTLCVDWSNLGNSTYSEGPFVVAGSNFDRNQGRISPVNGGENLDDHAHFTMYRAQYRWFGSNASVVLNTAVDAGSERAGIRWAEVRSSDGDSGWFLQQDGTFAPADGLERWMGSIAQDGDGNIALGYSVAGANLFPGVRYTTRMAGDAAGTMPGGEESCVEGTGAQTGSSNRWGDYSSMSIDPVDDCTFWYTQEYYVTTGSFDFNTRICSFTLADCGVPVTCVVDGDCNNGSYCDGAETCNPDTSLCEAGTSVDCEDDMFCNGAETCNESTESCDPGTSPDSDDGVGCTVDTCNEATDSFDHTADDALCDNGAWCDGTETCDLVNDCQVGSDPCPGQICDEAIDFCAGTGCGDDLCDSGEDCNSCPEDCISGPLPGASCGNGLCEAGNNENGANCSADCAGKLNGKPGNRFSCGFNDSYGPDGCGDARCTSGVYSCTETQVSAGSFCCGDGDCEGAEDGFSCEIDCNVAPGCGDGNIDFPAEQCDGSNLGGASCTSLNLDFTGGDLACDAECSFDTDACTSDICESIGDSCTSNSDCCSNKCKGKSGSKTCK